MSHPLSPPPDQSEDSQPSPTRRLRACESCRLRKIKCPGPDNGLDGICSSCFKANRPCVFRAKTIVKRRRRVEGRIRDLEQRILDLSEHLQSHGAAATERQDSDASSDQHDPGMSTPERVVGEHKVGVDAGKDGRGWTMKMVREKKGGRKHSSQATPSWEHEQPSLHIHFEQFFSGLKSIAPTLGIRLASFDAGAARLLIHFENEAVNAFGPPWLSDILRTWGFQLATQAPFLLQTMCAFAALHLKYLHQNSDPVVEQTIEHLLDRHFQLALRLYSAELSKPPRPDTMDALLAACMLFAMIAYATNTHSPASNDGGGASPSSLSQDSHSHSHNHSLAWLTSQTGFGVIKNSPVLKPHLPHSIWRRLLAESRFHSESHAAPLPVARVPADWLALGRTRVPVRDGDEYEYEDEEEEEGGPYAHALRYVAHVRDVDPRVPENFSYFICFPGHMSGEFKGLLARSDPVAMMFLLHWLAKMCVMDYWWSRGCVLMEGRAIFRRLEGKCGEEGVVRRLLETVRAEFGG